MLEHDIVSDILEEDLILPDGTRIPKEEIDWTRPIPIKYPTDDSNEQTNAERDLSESLRDILDKESKLD